MRALTLKELFSGYNDVEIPDNIGIDEVFIPTVDQSDTNNNSLLFILDKVGNGISTQPECTSVDASTIVTSRDRLIKDSKARVVRVGNAREALAYALSNTYAINYDKIKIIGITGTNGKTTTASLIYHILQKAGYSVGFIGTGRIISDNVLLTSPNYSMTTPDPTLLYRSISKMIDDGCTYVVMEVSSHSIALKKVAPIRFYYSIFTNLGEDHLDFHKDKEEYFHTKLQLFHSTQKGLFNLDDYYVRRAAVSAPCSKSTFGIIHEADTFATDICINKLDGSTFFYRENGLIFKAQTNLIGAFNVYNALAALKCVIDLGIKPCVAKSALEEIKSVDGRMQFFRGRTNAVIDYAHTPSAFSNCLKTIKDGINRGQKLIVVFGCGGDRDKRKRPLFGKIAEELADKIVICEDNSRGEPFSSIAKDIASGIMGDFEIIQDRESAIKYGFNIANDGDVVAVIGKGHEKYKLVNNEYIPFDEAKIVLEAQTEAIKRLCE